jgi:hypothetical protein
LFVGVGLWVATAACELLLPTTLLEPGKDAGPGPPVSSGPCGALPPTDPGGPAGTGDLLVAIRTFEFQGNDATFGYNLDGVCTCDDAGLANIGVGPSCKPPFPGVQQSATCDAPGGRDLGGIKGIGPYFQEALAGAGSGNGLDDRIATGQVSFLFRVRNLPDGNNGSGVGVEFFNASGLFEKLGAPQADGSTLGNVAPKWDGTDSWAINCTQSGAACASKYELPDAGAVASAYLDRNAYVRDGQLVAHFLTLLLDFNYTDILLTNAVMVAKVTNDPDAGGRGLVGQIAARLPLRELFKSLAAVTIGGKNNAEYVCGNSLAFTTARPQICQSLDLMADPSQDNADPLQNCNALGVAFEFTASPAQFAYHVDPGPYVRACDGGNLTDDCSHP